MAKTDILQDYRRQFEQFEKQLNGASDGPLHRIRRTAFDQFMQTGFPNARDEEWRFTNIQPIASRAFVSAPKPASDRFDRADIDRLAIPSRYRLVFIDGHFQQGLSDLPGGTKASVGNLPQVLSDRPELAETTIARGVTPQLSGFAALNTSFMTDGFCLTVPAGTVLDEPVAIVYLSSGETPGLAAYPRNLIVLGEQASATIVEYYVSARPGEYLTNAVTEVVLGEQARLEHDKVQFESLSAFHIASVHVLQERSSVYVSNNIALGGRIARTDITAVLSGEGCECTLNGLTIGNRQQLIDNHTTIDHAKPHCNSWEVYKAVLDGEARGVFNGKIFVRQDAQKTDAKQTNQTLLLSDTAMIDTKPQLEIFADDVKCTHGATVGQLDEQQVFYLRSRGIPRDDARDILTYGFAGEVVQEVHYDELKPKLEALIHQRLDEGRG